MTLVSPRFWSNFKIMSASHFNPTKSPPRTRGPVERSQPPLYLVIVTTMEHSGCCGSAHSRVVILLAGIAYSRLGHAVRNMICLPRACPRSQRRWRGRASSAERWTGGRERSGESAPGRCSRRGPPREGPPVAATVDGRGRLAGVAAIGRERQGLRAPVGARAHGRHRRSRPASARRSWTATPPSAHLLPLLSCAGRSSHGLAAPSRSRWQRRRLRHRARLPPLPPGTTALQARDDDGISRAAPWTSSSGAARWRRGAAWGPA
jgi:hypothetical protein